eukprot:scaffold55260_cov69-Phaeocystis_antarctica.AAC.1
MQLGTIRPVVSQHSACAGPTWSISTEALCRPTICKSSYTTNSLWSSDMVIPPMCSRWKVLASMCRYADPVAHGGFAHSEKLRPMTPFNASIRPSQCFESSFRIGMRMSSSALVDEALLIGKSTKSMFRFDE